MPRLTGVAASEAASEGVVLEHPGLGHRLAAGFEERTQFNRVGPVDDEVELRPPVAGDTVRNRFDELVGPESFRARSRGRVRA